MKIACIGGGPAGLYLGILVKRAAPEHDVVVYERNRPTDTFGFGVVFSDATLGHLAAADPESHAQITSRFARWDDIEIHVGGEVLRSTGHGFCGLERKALLQILQQRAAELGVRIEFEREIKSLDEVHADVIVACDGVASWVRDALAADFGPAVDMRPNKFVWLGCTVPYEAFTFLFQDTPHGMFRVHAYRYHAEGSTFIAECREPTWRAAGLATASEDDTLAILERIFAAHLRGHRLIKNRSIWRNFPTVRCAKWHSGNVVLVGDAAHTAHFSIGSGTKLAMEDSIALRDALLATSDIPAALAAYEKRRRPQVESLQAAAQASLEWFEGTERYAHMAPVQFTYSLMTRSLRVSHESMQKRDPHLARGVEALLAAEVGVEPMQPMVLPFMLGDRRMRNRLFWFAHTPERVSHEAAPGLHMGMIVAAGNDFVAMASAVHANSGLFGARVLTTDLSADAATRAVRAAALAEADLLVLDPGTDPLAIEQLPAIVEAARAIWRAEGWIAACVSDVHGPNSIASSLSIIGHAAQLVRAGASLLFVSSAGDPRLAGARLPAAPLADRLRNELHVATAVLVPRGTSGEQTVSDFDAAIAAGRADLIGGDV